MGNFGQNIRGRLIPQKRSSRGILILLAVLVLLGIFHVYILRMLAWPLLTRDPPDTCAYFCIHGGELGADGFEPFERAAQWQREQAGRKILLLLPHDDRVVEVGAVPSFDETCRRELAKCGIPAADIENIRADAVDVWEEARSLGTWLKGHPEAKVQLGCSSLAGGRLRLVFNRVLAAEEAGRIHLETLTEPEAFAQSWWRSRRGVKEFMYAWLELGYAWAQGDPSPPYPPHAAEFRHDIRAKIGEAPK